MDIRTYVYVERERERESKVLDAPSVAPKYELALMSQASRRGRDAEKNEENEAWQNAQAHVCTRVRTHVRTYASTYREYATTEAWQNAQAHESAKPDSTAFSSPAMARPAPHPRAWKKWRGPLTLVRGLASSQTRGPGLLPKTLPRAKSNCPADFVRTYARWPPTTRGRSAHASSCRARSNTSAPRT